MDVLDKFIFSQSEMTEVTKRIFNILEEADVYKIIPYFELSNVQISALENTDMVEVQLYNFKDVSPKLAFVCDRETALDAHHTIITPWLAATKEAMEKVNAAKVLKFLKTFSVRDHELINLTIQACPTLIHNEHTEAEIAELMAQYMSKELLKRSNWECTNI